MRKIMFIMLAILPVWAWAASLSFTVSTSDVVYNATQNAFEFDRAGGWTLTKSPGAAQLPARTVNIILPAGAIVTHTAYSLSGMQSIPGAPPRINTPYSDGTRILAFQTQTQSVAPVSYLGIKQWGDIRFASFSLQPATYDAIAKQYRLPSTVSLTVDYSLAVPTTAAVSNKIPTTFKADGSFLNPTAVTQWYAQSQLRTYDYLVITTPSLYTAAATLVNFRQSQGMVTQYTNINAILATSPGANPAEKLRNYLISEYSTAPFTYLLLIGDIDIVPIAFLTPEPNGFDTVPSDFYFSDLTSDFDSDNDGNLGEYDSGMDYTPEIYVGRIPWNNATPVIQICNRTVSFESTTAAWKHKALLPAAMLNYANEDGWEGWEQTDGATLMEYLKSNVLSGYDVTTLYEQEGMVPSYASDLALTETNFNNLVQNQSWGLVSWSAHGSSTTSARKVWVQDNSNDGIPNAEEMQWMGMVSTSTYDNVPNADGSVYFCASCNNGMLDDDIPSLGEYLLKQKAVADIAATRTGWYKIGWANPGWGGLTSYNYHFVENYAGFGMTVGAAHGWANWLHTQYCIFGDSVDTGGIIWPELQNVYTYLLFGDPAVGYTSTAVNTAGQILIWEPGTHTGNNLLNGLHALGNYNVVYTDKLIEDYEYLNNFDAVFCLLGFGEDSYGLQAGTPEYAALLDYVTAGGKLYIEGYINWDSTDPLLSRFGASSPFDHLAMIEQISYGTDPALQIWEYNGWNQGAPALALTGGSSTELLRSHNVDYVDDIIGIWNQIGDSRTIASSFEIGSVTSELLTYPELLAIVLDTLGVVAHVPVPTDDHTTLPALSELKLYPNPFRQNMTVSFKATSPAEVRIYNVKGQLVQTTHVTPNAGKAQWQWDGLDSRGVSTAAGIYMLQIKQGSALRSLKLLKL